MASPPTPLPEGFATAFAELYPRARQVAYRILGDRAEAEDAAAEALTRTLVAWRKVETLPHRDAWVLRVTANVAVDWRRRRRARAEVDPVVPGDEEAIAVRLALAAALAALPRRQREVIALRYLVGMSEAEVAASLAVSVGSVKKHASRAMSGLRRRLGDEPEWNPGGVAHVAS